MVEPSNLAPHCTHKFCVNCLMTHFKDNNRTCPLCRTEIPYFFKIEVDKSFQKLLKAANYWEFSQAEKELKLEGSLSEKVDLDFEIGHKFFYNAESQMENKY